MIMIVFPMINSLLLESKVHQLEVEDVEDSFDKKAREESCPLFGIEAQIS